MALRIKMMMLLIIITTIIIRIVLDCAAERIRDILMQAQQVGMMTGDLK